MSDTNTEISRRLNALTHCEGKTLKSYEVRDSDGTLFLTFTDGVVLGLTFIPNARFDAELCLGWFPADAIL